jgi:hypothetical protein
MHVQGGLPAPVLSGEKIFNPSVCRKRPVYQYREKQPVLTQLLDDDSFLGHMHPVASLLPAR